MLQDLRSVQALPAFGFLARVMRDHVYEFDGQGFLFTSAWVNTVDTLRHAATILLSASGDPFHVSSGDQVLNARAVLVPPLVRRTLRACDVGLISINMTPNHWSYNALKQLGGTRLIELEFSHFQALQPEMQRAYRGQSDRMAAEQLMERAVGLTIEQLPGVLPPMRRSGQDLLSLLSTNEEWTLPQVADKLHLSYDRASHVVADTLGLSFKSYLYWRKMVSAWSALQSPSSLTEVAQTAGFSDSAHLARTWKQKLGVSPSYIRNQELVSVMR